MTSINSSFTWIFFSLFPPPETFLFIFFILPSARFDDLIRRGLEQKQFSFFFKICRPQSVSSISSSSSSPGLMIIIQLRENRVCVAVLLAAVFSL
jgi:hypothetical protein